jgi:hypothetical protein
MDTGFLIFVMVALLGVFVFVYTQKRDNIKVIIEKVSAPAPTPEPVRAVQVAPAVTNYNTGGYDHRNPPPPARVYDTPADLTGMAPPGVPAIPIQVPTRGLPEQFQQIGVLSGQGGTDTSASPERTLLPLFGRRVAASRERYNYYTRTDGFNPVQVPVSFKNRNCDDDNGCDEIMKGDSVGVPLLGKTFVATVYKLNAPRYIPIV